MAKKTNSRFAGEKFATIDEAVERLKEEGFKISRSKMFTDARGGDLRRQPDGSILGEDLGRYVKIAGLVKPGATEEDEDALSRLKVRQTLAEIREREAKASMAEMDERKRAGELISREEADKDMARAVTAFRASLKNFFGEKALEIIHRVNGDPLKQDELMDFFGTSTNGFFNGFAKKREIVIEDGDDASGAD